MSVAAFATFALASLPAEAATRTCVQDLYNYLNSAPSGKTRSVDVSINGMFPGSLTLSQWAFFGRGNVETSFNATYGGAMLRSVSINPNFVLYYDHPSDSQYFAQPSVWFTFQSIPVNDAHRVRLAGNGAVFEIAAQCMSVGLPATSELLGGFDQYGYWWTMSFRKREIPF